jgi:Zn-dependent M28 family amino/carboxypeptidase
MSKTRIGVYLAAIVALLLAVSAWYAFAFKREAGTTESRFDGQRALGDVQQQVQFGPRIPGSEAHARALDWMQAELTAAGWQVQRQESESMGHPIINLVASRSDASPRIVLGAHFDSRLEADRDPQVERRAQPTPGANDGASGVAVLLELARSLPHDGIPITLVFFDAEDNGRIPGWDWILGSRAFVASLSVKPEKMILVDMVGDKDLQIRPEANSEAQLRDSIWAVAARLGHADAFPTNVGGAILDDHVPFLEAGIPSVDLIDINYEYWHTSADTPDKVSAQSLQIVGDVLWKWLVEQNTPPPAQ